MLSMITFLIYLCNIPLVGFVASRLWGWFIVPTFGMPPVGTWVAAGCILFVNLLRGWKEPRLADVEDIDDERVLAHRLKWALKVSMTYLMFLGIGYAVHLLAG